MILNFPSMWKKKLADTMENLSFELILTNIWVKIGE